MADIVGGTIVWNLNVDDSKFTAGLAKAQAQADTFAADAETKVTGASNGIASAFKDAEEASTGFAVSLAVLGAGIGVAIGYGLKYAANIETMRAGYITLLGSASQADAAIKMIQKDAATTPFNFSGLVQDNELLTSVTHNASSSERVLLDMGKALTAMGKGTNELDRVVVNMQQIASVGHAATIDIKQFAIAGIPIYQMLESQLHVTGAQLNDMITQGKITYDTIVKTFEAAGEGSGQYAQAFVQQGGTMNQVWSNFVDNIGIVLSTIVQSTGIFDKAKVALSGLTNSLAYLATPAGIAGIMNFFKFLQDNLPIIAGVIIGGLTPAIFGMVMALLPLIPFLAVGAAIGIVVEGIMSAFSKVPSPLLIGIAAGITAIGIALLVTFTPAIIAATVAAWAFVAPILIAAAPFIALGLGVALVVAGIVLLITHWQQIANFLSGVFKPIIADVIHVFQGLAAFLVDFFTGGDITATWYQYFGTAFMGVIVQIDNFRQGIITAWGNIVSFFTVQVPQLAVNFGKWLEGLPQAFLNMLTTLFLDEIRGWGLIVGLLVFGVPALITQIMTFFGTLPALLQAWWLGLVTWWNTTWTAFSTWTVTTVTTLVNDIMTWFNQLPGRIQTAITTAFNNFVNTATAWYNNAVNWASNLIKGIMNWIETLPAQFMTAITDTQNQATSGFNDLWTAIVGIVSAWPGQLYNWGVNLMNSFANGIKSAIGAIANAFEAGMNDAKKLVESHSPPVAGPFKDIGKWGFNTGLAWAEGMQSAMSGLDIPMPDAGGFSTVSSVGPMQVGGGSQSSTVHAPAFSVNLGVFVGTESEKRQLAKMLNDSYQQYLKGRGQA